MSENEQAKEILTLEWDIDQENSKSLKNTAAPLNTLGPNTDENENTRIQGAVSMIRPPDPKNDALLRKLNGENKKGESLNAARERAKAKIQEIRKLRKDNQTLKTKVTQHDQQMHAALTEIKVRDKQLTEAVGTNKRLDGHLQEELENLKHYKQRVQNFDQDTQKYRDRIRELIELKKEETEVRQNLENELKSISQEIMTLRDQKIEAETLAKNTQEKLDIRIKMGEEMKEKFKEEKENMQQDFLEEQERFKICKQQAEKLALDVVKLSKENMALEKELTKQDETIQGIFSETQSQQQAITLLQNENRSLRKELVKVDDERERLATELETANDRLKKMAERVYYLVNRLTDLEEYKGEAEKKLRMNAKEHQELEHRAKQLQHQIQIEEEAKLTVADEVKSLRISTVEYRKAATDYENKFKKLRRSNKKMQELLQAKTLKLREILASNEVRMRKNKDDSGQRNLYASLQKKIDQLISSSEFLKKKVHHLERVNSKYQYTIKKRETEIKDLKKKNRLVTAFSTKQTQQHNTKIKSKTQKGESSSSIIFDYSEAYQLFSRDFGFELEKFLQFYQLNEQTFFSQLSHPLELIEHIVSRHVQVIPTITTNPCDPETRRITQLERQNASLSAKIHECEDIKIKSIMRLAAVLVNTPNKKSQLPTTLTLNNNLIDDICAGYLADALQSCSHIVKVDLRSNHISDKGVMLLVGAALANESITHLILRDNRISLRGMQKLYSTLKQYCDHPPEFEKLNNRKIPILLVTVKEKDLCIDVRENNFDPDTMKQIETTTLDDLKDQREEDSFEARDLNFSERFEKWIVSQTHCAKLQDINFDPSRGTKGSSGRYYQQNSGRKLNKSVSTPSFANSRTRSNSRPNSRPGSRKEKRVSALGPLSKRLKQSALHNTSKIGGGNSRFN